MIWNSMYSDIDVDKYRYTHADYCDKIKDYVD